jgi:hypothetical protein
MAGDKAGKQPSWAIARTGATTMRIAIMSQWIFRALIMTPPFMRPCRRPAKQGRQKTFESLVPPECSKASRKNTLLRLEALTIQP